MNISVIIIFKDCPYIDKVIKQVSKQINDKDEIIIINDNSQEPYKSLINPFKELNNFTILDSLDHGSRSANRNLGASLAKNDILVFLDGDVYLYPNTLQKIKQKFKTQPFVAYSGNLHGLEYSKEQLDLMDKDYSDYSDIELFNLHKDNQLKDHRTMSDKTIIFNDWEWMIIYSGLLAVDKKSFIRSGMFNESLRDWGAEDIELAYKLSQKYPIKYDREINGIHLPHKRNHIKNLYTNCCNLYRLLETYKNPYFELPIKFYNPGKVNKILEENLYYNKEDESLRDFFGEKNSIYIDYGKKINYFDNCSKCVSLPLFGVALPFNTNTINCAYISQNIMKYGDAFASVIIQESLRIAKDVRIIKTDFNSKNSYYDNNDNNTIKNNAINNSIYYVNTSIKNYVLSQTESYFKVQSDLSKLEINCL